ncbi:hypothetical protein HU200_021223 [Digitaria exilis]|uniref:Uncharacterized protein n=1 Tax=Digitaria exilis TaxID=1010633 RepID=A0A835F068_9POAL|nr:hypothetical protein HU200_021223 [Digitaria exilis]
MKCAVPALGQGERGGRPGPPRPRAPSLDTPRLNTNDVLLPERHKAVWLKQSPMLKKKKDQQSPKAEKGLYFAGLTGTGRGIFGSGMDAEFIANDISCSPKARAH